MPYSVRKIRRGQRKPKPRNQQTLQKPNGVIGPRVKKVGGERFAIVCVDPAKHRSEWMMADYFGNLLIEPQTVEHRGVCFRSAIELVRQTQQQHNIQDMIVVVERTGNYHLPPKRAFARAGFETRVVHPFATKQYRMPADPGNKTDGNDLKAQHRAAVAGFGLSEGGLDSPAASSPHESLSLASASSAASLFSLPRIRSPSESPAEGERRMPASV